MIIGFESRISQKSELDSTGKSTFLSVVLKLVLAVPILESLSQGEGGELGDQQVLQTAC